MKRETMLKPALISGVILGIVSAFPVISALNCFCCAWVIGAGILAAHLYVKSSPLAVTLGSGALLGMVTGIVGAIVDTLFSIPLFLLMRGSGTGIFEQLQQALDKMPDVNPAAREWLQSILTGGSGMGILLIILAGVFYILIFGLAGMLGGALGVALFEKRKVGQPTTNLAVSVEPPPPPYEPPAPPPQ